MFTSSILFALALATPNAEAGRIGKKPIDVPAGVSVTVDRRARHIGLLPFVTDTVKRVSVVVPPGEATAVSAELTSDSGTESVTLVETDAWLHGTANLSALPTTDADLLVTVYDEASAALIAFSGTLGADGTATLVGRGCNGQDDDCHLDIEVLAAEVFANPAGGYRLALDFNGADTYSAAYADVRIDEGSTVTTCTKLGCTTTGTILTTRAEVDFDDAGARWEGELRLEHDGEVEVQVITTDEDGKKLETSTSYAGRAVHMVQDSYASGHTMLSAGAAGSVGYIRKVDQFRSIGYNTVVYDLVVVSDNWTNSTAPALAEVELEGGEMLRIPANSYQRTGHLRVELEAVVITHLKLSINGGSFSIDDETLSVADMVTPVCDNGTCIALATNEKGSLEVSVTEYASDLSGLSGGATISILAMDKSGAKVGSVDSKVSFDEAVTVIFANEVGFSEDPSGLDLGGKVTLLSAADARGKETTLAKGEFAGTFARTAAGALSLDGADDHDIVAAGDIVVVGDAVVQADKTSRPACVTSKLKGEGTAIATYCP